MWLRRGPHEARRASEFGVRVIVPLVIATFPAALRAQSDADTVAACDGSVVSEITIAPRDPSFLSFPPWLRPLARAVGLHHTTSKADVIGRFVLLEVGQPCTERQRSESERILRLQPFLADASVRAVADSDGRVRIEVATIDEIPTVFDLRLRDMRPSALRLGNGNVGGQGLHLAANVERGFAYRTGMGVEATAYQILGRANTLSLVAERAPLGSTLAFALGRPFLTDLQRTAWHVGFRDVDDYISFVPPQGDALSLGVERRLWDLGGVRRIGLGRDVGFVGFLLTQESVTPESRVVVVSDSGLVTDTSGALGGPIPAYRNRRLNAVVGLRALSFLTVRGFDALTAVQDVAMGVQIGTLMGLGLSGAGTQGGDRIVVADLYAGFGSPTSFARLRVAGEARMDPLTGRWDSMVGGGRLAWYTKRRDGHVLIGSVEFGGGRSLRIPFQLRLGDHQGGVRGYAASRRAGAARTVLRLEERWVLGGPTQHGSFGLAGFVDAGWVWAGDAPFGTDSGLKAGVGLALLAAFPPQSPRLWRLDLAVPLSGDPHARWEVRLTSNWVRSFWREPHDVSLGRAGAAPSTIFGWR